MDEIVVYWIASVEVLFAWVGTALFVLAYAWWSPWRSDPIGVTLMQRAGAMLLLLTLALTNRWLDFSVLLQQLLALGVYLLIGVMEWRLFVMLRRIQRESKREKRKKENDV